MVSPQLERLLLSTYSACTEYILDQPKLRDYTITFYITVCAFYIGWFNSMTSFMAYLISFAMIVFGVICNIRIIGHKVLNIQYVQCIKIINGMFLSTKMLQNEADIALYLNTHLASYRYTIRSLFSSVGCVTAIGFFVITTVPLIVLLFSIESIPSLFATLLSGFYMVVYCVLFTTLLLARVNSFSKAHWLFQIPVLTVDGIL